MPNAEELGLAAGAVESLLPETGALGRSLLDVVSEGAPDARFSGAMFQQALKLAPNSEAEGQLLAMRSVQTQLAGARIESLAPVDGTFLSRSIGKANLLLPNGTRSTGYVWMVGDADGPVPAGYLSRFRTDMPSQFVSANLFNTVPKSVVRDIQFTPDMFKSPAGLANDIQAVEKLKAGGVFNPQDDPAASVISSIGQGKPIKVILTEDAGATVKSSYADPIVANPLTVSSGKLVRLAGEDASTRLNLQKAIVDREVIGDTDGNAGNMTIVGAPEHPTSIGNIDMQLGFSSYDQPVLTRLYRSPLLSGQSLSPRIPLRTAQFVDSYGTTAGTDLL
ncbi:MAG: hypothetical protein ACRD3W_32140, partial [Terriglobales bacterium]